ncbi:MAG: RimK family protein [Polyangiaceae bacterium]
MRHLLITDDDDPWLDDLSGVERVDARDYLTDPDRWPRRGIKAFNLCRSYRYQSTGYYVSLLAAARGHRPVPNVATIQDLKSTEIVRVRSGELDELINKSLGPIKSERFILSIYFGHNMAKRHDRLAARIHQLFPVPLLRARFTRRKDGRWEIVGIRAIGREEIPEPHEEFAEEAAKAYFARRWRPDRHRAAQYDLAILTDPDEPEAPSDDRAIARFQRVARKLGMNPWIIGKDDYADVAEFDALLIRATTRVNHFTYRFARRADSEGMVVIDDPVSILRCTNKVYLAELLERHGVAAPDTMVVHRQNLDRVVERLGLPVVLKLPDSSFSLGVVKAETEDELHERASAMFDKTELLVAQAFTPTEFDWRVGLFDGKPLWVCRYHMAPKHWQIVKAQGKGRRWGRVEALPVSEAPKAVLRTAVKAASLVGDGLYGVDLKQVGRRVLVIEINDNPTIESGEEDAILGDALYETILGGMKSRLEARGEDR